MGAPQFYSMEETAGKLGMTEDQVKNLTRDGKLREFRDRGQLFFKTDEVDRLVEGGGQDGGAISLDDSSIDSIPLIDEGPIGDSAIGDSAVGASKAGDSALSGTGLGDSAFGDSDLSDSAIGASHAGQAASTPAKDADESGMGEFDISDGSSIGISSADLQLEPADDQPQKAKDREDTGLGLSGTDGFAIEDLDEPEKGEGDSKEDTVITSVGISVFDDDEIEIDVDPLAKTRISPSVEDQISLEGVGSGSGLLDLTRESDDTSLGAELLDEIYPGEEESTVHEDMPTEVVPGMTAGAVAGGPGFAPGGMQPWGGAVAPVAPDPAAAGFTGMMVVGLIMLGLTGTVMTAAVQGVVPSFLGMLYEQWIAVAGGGIGLAVACLLIGWAVGRQQGGPKTPSKKRLSKAEKKAAKAEEKAAESDSAESAGETEK